MNDEDKKLDAQIVADRLALERKQDLTVLQLLEDTPKAERKAMAEHIGLHWDEYIQLLAKYRRVMERYRAGKQPGIAVGDACNRDGCKGEIKAMNGPCYCSECDWEEEE